MVILAQPSTYTEVVFVCLQEIKLSDALKIIFVMTDCYLAAATYLMWF